MGRLRMGRFASIMLKEPGRSLSVRVFRSGARSSVARRQIDPKPCEPRHTGLSSSARNAGTSSVGATFGLYSKFNSGLFAKSRGILRHPFTPRMHCTCLQDTRFAQLHQRHPAGLCGGLGSSVGRKSRRANPALLEGALPIRLWRSAKVPRPSPPPTCWHGHNQKNAPALRALWDNPDACEKRGRSPLSASP
jgi:hypothetical protein